MTRPSPYPPALLAFARDGSRRGPPATPEAAVGHAHNRLCGDRLSVALSVDADGRVSAARFDGEGCALSVAASAALCAALEGGPLDRAPEVLARLRAAVEGAPPGPEAQASLEGLDVFVAVAPFPSRHRCVTLSTEAAGAALAAVDLRTGVPGAAERPAHHPPKGSSS